MLSAHVEPRPDLAPRRFAVGVVALLVVHVGMLVALASLLPWTRDEYPYLKAGAILRTERSWEVAHTTFHGPLPFFANQLAAWFGVAPVEPADDYLFWGRLGMLPFAVVGALALTWLARRLFDRRVALAALALHAANPVVLANAPLLTCDAPLAALYVLVVALAFAQLRRPSWWGGVALGASLGAALATKYLALFLLPVLGGALLVAVCLGWPADGVSRGLGARLARAAGVVALVAGIALLTLHTCYLWAVPGYRVPPPSATPLPPLERLAAPRSGLLQAAVRLPLVPDLLQLLPEPFVRGVDFQKMQSEAAGETPFFAATALGHPGYFAVSFALKLPLAWLALLGLGLVAGCRGAYRWPARARTLLALAAGVPFVYLSFFSVLQNGIRYLLPTVVLATLPAACGAAWLLSRGRPARLALGGLAAALLGCHAITWPRYDTASNALAGSRPYLVFADANYDWTARHFPDERALLDVHPGAVRGVAALGPTFGRFVINGTELARPDPRQRGRLYHWLRRFHPAARRGGFLLFAIDEAAFAGADAAAAPRSRVELAIARLGVGDAPGALAAIDGVTDPDAPAVRAAAEALRAGSPRGPDWCQIMSGLGRLDAVVAADSGALPLQRATAHWQFGQFARARAVLEAEAAQRRLTQPEVYLLATVLAGVEEHAAALRLLDDYAPAPGSPERPAHDSLRRMLDAEIGAWRRLRAK
jgi:4-amino-4-deoxy-L-arabinose transferase-like glycosyltransferase